MFSRDLPLVWNREITNANRTDAAIASFWATAWTSKYHVQWNFFLLHSVADRPSYLDSPNDKVRKEHIHFGFRKSIVPECGPRSSGRQRVSSGWRWVFWLIPGWCGSEWCLASTGVICGWSRWAPLYWRTATGALDFRLSRIRRSLSYPCGWWFCTLRLRLIPSAGWSVCYRPSLTIFTTIDVGLSPAQLAGAVYIYIYCPWPLKPVWWPPLSNRLLPGSSLSYLASLWIRTLHI